jgi:uridylate kinase
MKIVISLGGSLLTRELSPDNFKKYVDVIKKLHKLGHKLIVVCGGGKVCRDYQNIAKAFNASKNQLDFIGIMATHLNASTLSSCLGKSAYLVKWKSLKEAGKEVKKYFNKKIIVAAGYDVGTSTDYDSAYFAKLVKANLLINVTNVDGVYDKDPKKYPDAKKFEKIGYEEFIKIIKKNEQVPGEYRLFDLKAARLIKKIKLKTLIIDGTNPEEIIRAVNGRHNGTEIA